MDHIPSRDAEFELDLESGGTTSEEDVTKDLEPVSTWSSVTLDRFLCRGYGSLDGSIMREDRANLCHNVSNSTGFSVGNVKVEKEGKFDSAEKPVKEKRQKTGSKKAPKPPRPPRGPSLDPADHKLIREISELAMLKRARVERMKAVRKMKAAKTSSSNSNCAAMVFTVLFCLVIIFQGMSSKRASSVSFHGSPESAAVRDSGLISIQYYGNPSHTEINGLGSGSPSLVEQVSGSDRRERVGRFGG